MSQICKFCSLCENSESLLSIYNNKYTTTLHSTTFSALPTLTRTQADYIFLLFFPLNFSFILPQFVSISLFLSLCLCLSLRFCLSLCFCLCPFLSPPPPPPPPPFLSLSFCFWFVCFSVYLCIRLSVFLFVCLSLPPRFCLFLFFCLRFCLFV